MAFDKITALPAAASILSTDIVPCVIDPAGTPITKKVTVAVLLAPAKAAVVSELSFASGLQIVTSTTFTRVGSRIIDMSRFLNITGYTRHVRLLVDIDKSPGATSGDVQLIDVTNGGVLITSTALSTTSNANEEKDSGDLTIGSSSGNIRSDVAAMYELQMKRIGGVEGTDMVSITNARLLIYYT